MVRHGAFAEAARRFIEDETVLKVLARRLAISASQRAGGASSDARAQA